MLSSDDPLLDYLSQSALDPDFYPIKDDLRVKYISTCTNPIGPFAEFPSNIFMDSMYFPEGMAGGNFDTSGAELHTWYIP